MPNSYVVGWSVGTVGLAFPVLKASLSPCSAALDSNLRSRADRINELSGDVGATWRTALKQIHSRLRRRCCHAQRRMTTHDSSTFCQFFAPRRTAVYAAKVVR